MSADPLCCRDTNKHSGDLSHSAISKFSRQPLSSFFKSSFWLLIEEAKQKKQKEAKSHNWKQMKDDASGERPTSSRYPIRAPNLILLAGEGAACRGDVNKEQKGLY